MTNFQKLVKDSNKSLTQISKETRIRYPTLGNYNQGTRTPKKENALKLAKYFGVSVSYLLDLEKEPYLPNSIEPEIIEKLTTINQQKN
ncbi:XRE family transcriptional regulator [Streptococcus iniae]|uniref:helix-turn-helix domain-containing protein n=1 Tax=Streptococcus iniae TaxID=1346 RepID=UPI00035FD785|nr:XRE family transcriptional regulator [Streptococcus iniae]HEK4517273.1 helix-turn-helix transcriptional regulator [Streptococcus iniae]